VDERNEACDESIRALDDDGGGGQCRPIDRQRLVVEVELSQAAASTEPRAAAVDYGATVSETARRA